MEPLQAIDVVNIFPEYTSQFALYCKSGNTQREAYVKRTKILDLFTASGMSVLKTPHASQITAHEASICARLSFHEHSNIAEFLGVQISNVLEFDYHGAPIHVSLPGKYITGLVFTKYDCTLHDLVIRRQKFDTRLCLQSIWGGIQYLHYVGVVHGDIRPHKIFVKRGKNKDHFVIGDFDCAHDLGSVVTFKAGDPRWTKRKTIGKDIAKKSDDWSGFVMLKEWLVKEVGGKLADYEDIGKNRRAVQG
jgi:serine/threonine protein kinase